MTTTYDDGEERIKKKKTKKQKGKVTLIPFHFSDPCDISSTTQHGPISTAFPHPIRPLASRNKHLPFFLLPSLLLSFACLLLSPFLDPSGLYFKSHLAPQKISPNERDCSPPTRTIPMAATEEVSKPPNLPPYPEMILAAITALNEKNGSNKSAISKYIESSYGELPQSHASLLTAHLARMKESGDLLLIKNNYLKPGPDVPPKRGRGRPPKPKPVLPPGTVLPPPRPRGRPPKPKDPLAAAVAKANKGLPKARGRPPKKARPAVSAAAPPSDGAPVKRGRGRPPKAKPVVANDGA